MSIVIGLTYNLEEDYVFSRPLFNSWRDPAFAGKEDAPYDANAEFDREETIDMIAASLESFGYKVIKIGGLENLLASLDGLRVDIVFNLGEGMSGRNRESQIPIILEAKGIPFVGADGLTLGLALDKLMTKKLLAYEGIPTPKFFTVEDSLSLNGLYGLKFPMIVKPRWEGSSKGISVRSRVERKEELAERIDELVYNYQQPALVEEFIRGREFTVAMIGNDRKIEILPIAQIKINGKIDLCDEFYTYDYIFSDKLEYVCPAEIDEALKERIEDLAVRTYRLVECRDFGRVDIRVDLEGRPYVLEINPLPSLSTEDVFSVVAKFWGMDYSQMIKKILDVALERYEIR